jgi:hypothetical protein
MSVAEAGLSTLGVKFGYGVETTAGTKPAAFSLLERINAIGGISISNEQIDASALEDYITRYVAGRSDTGGSVEVTINYTDETRAQWEALLTAYQALTDGKRMWFETYHPKLTKAFFFVAQPPSVLPQPEMGQNGLLTVAIPLVIEEFIGADTAIEPTDTSA